MTTPLKTILISGVTAGVVSGIVLASALTLSAPASSQSLSQSSVSSLPTFASSQEQSIVNAVQKTEPAVVSVIISKDVPVVERYYRQPMNNNPFGNDPFFDQFFSIPEYRQNGTEKREVGGGTAFFISADGLLMTNNHVVDDEKAEYTVFLNDGRKLKATVLARDSVTDIALLKVEGSNFPYLEISDRAEPMLGQTSIAIGNALGEFRNTVSVGVISGLQRTITAGGPTGASEELNQIIQTDAAINQGNSGGPLIDTNGTVIGMNTAVAGGAQGIAFAIPASDLQRVMKSYKTYGRIVRPYIGIRYTPITPELKEKNKLAYDYGALVVRGENPGELGVVPGSPADKAGIKENDIILSIDGQKLTEEISLGQIVQRKNPGDVLRLQVSSAGRVRDVSVTLEEWKEK
jgi:S1-C subfamily serine protease